MLVNYFQSVDKDGNCFPSLHVIIPIMFSGIYSWIAISRMRICMIWAWTVLIVVSVFTTKQHYVVDVFGAVVMVVPVIFYLKRKVLREVKMIPTLRP